MLAGNLHSCKNPELCTLSTGEAQALCKFLGMSHMHAGRCACLSIQLQQQVVAVGAAAKGEVDEAVYAQLPHIIQPARPQVLAQLQSEVGGRVTLVSQHLQACWAHVIRHAALFAFTACLGSHLENSPCRCHHACAAAGQIVS